jgi:hypothetical protein
VYSLRLLLADGFVAMSSHGETFRFHLVVRIAVPSTRKDRRAVFTVSFEPPNEYSDGSVGGSRV